MAQVELVVTEPAVLTAIVTADAVRELQIKRGDHIVAVIKSTSVMVEH
jgi:molybdopterin-binding protein